MAFEINFLNKKFQDLRKDGGSIDVTLKIEEKKISAHRLVLSACSPYFNAMFNSGLAESNSGTIVMKGVNGDAVEAIIDFFYTSKINLSYENVSDVLQASCYLHIDELQQYCCSYLRDYLTVENCWSVRMIADMNSCDKLKDYVDKFIRIHFNDFINSEDFFKLTVDNVEHIISHDKVHTTSEECMFKAVMMWIYADIAARVRHLTRLLRQVRFQLIRLEYVDVVVRNDPYIQRNEESWEIVEEARKMMDPFERMSKARRGGMIFSSLPVDVNGKLRCIFGNSDYWRTATSLHDEIPICGLAYHDGRVFVLREKISINACGPWQLGVRQNTMMFYDLLANKWVTCSTSVPRYTRSYSMVVVRGYFYCFSLDEPNTTVIDRYHLEENTWSKLQPLVAFDAFTCVVALGNFIYALACQPFTFTSNNSPISETSYRNRVSRYDPVIDEWVPVTPRMYLRKHMAVAVFDEEIYVVGGWDDSGPIKGEKYNPHSDDWTPIKDLPLSPDIYGVTLAVVNSKLCAFGGFTITAFFRVTFHDIVYVYDKQNDSWTKTEELKLPCVGRYNINLKMIAIPEQEDTEEYETFKFHHNIFKTDDHYLLNKYG